MFDPGCNKVSASVEESCLAATIFSSNGFRGFSASTAFIASSARVSVLLLQKTDQNRARFLARGKDLAQFVLRFFQVRFLGFASVAEFRELAFDLISGSFCLDRLLQRFSFRSR